MTFQIGCLIAEPMSHLCIKQTCYVHSHMTQEQAGLTGQGHLHACHWKTPLQTGGVECPVVTQHPAKGSAIPGASPVARIEVHHPDPPARDLGFGHDEARKKVEQAVEIAGQDSSHLDVGRQSHCCET